MSIEATQINYHNAGKIGDMLGVRAATVCRWAKRGYIPKIILPNGRFLFDPESVIAALKARGGDHAKD